MAELIQRKYVSFAILGLWLFLLLNVAANCHWE